MKEQDKHTLNSPVAIREHLLSLQASLRGLAETGREASSTVELDQSRVGRLSRMDALQAQAMSQEGERRRELELQRIGAALRRLDEGDYGDCVRCGEAINPRRLAVDPAAPLCIDCASQAERD